MKKQKKTVYIQDWMRFHSITKQTSCDNYYLGLCKEVFNLIQNKDYEGLMLGLADEELKDFSCFLTSYFEDVISKTGIWQAFTTAHHELYNKYLPFYKLDEYYPDEVNPQDIQFLIWYFISRKFIDEYLSPFYSDIVSLGSEVYEIFDREFETAPENIKLKTYLSISESETDYYKIRNIADWLFINSYLFHFQEYEFGYEMQKILDSDDKDVVSNAIAIGEDIRDSMAISQSSNLLAFRGKDWMARVLGKNHALYNDIINLDKRKNGYFLFKGEDPGNVILQHIASDKVLKVTKKSIEVLPEFKIGKTIFLINLIKWKGEWWFSGVYTSMDYHDGLVKAEKESVESIDLFRDILDKTDKSLEKQYDSFLKFNNNKPIAFFENGQQIRDFINRFIKFYNSGLSILGTKMDSGEISNEKFHADIEDQNGLVYFDKCRGLSLIFGQIDAIPDNDNIAFNPESKTDIVDFIFSQNYRPNFVKYLIENYPSLLENYEMRTGENFIHDNIDFLLRFWKHEMFE